MHTVIVPGVGGSDHDHWQSWLQRQLMSCSRVEQQDWNLPILKQWIQNFTATILPINEPVQIVAHSYGCLTTVAAIHEHPELAKKIKKVVLVAPANPSRFGDQGFARNSANDYAMYFHQIKLRVPTDMIISENDPWLNFDDAQALAHSWNIQAINLGQVGHINVASGFGPFPEIYDFLILDPIHQQHRHIHESKLFFKFAI